MKTIQEQITDLQNTRAAKAARMEEVVKASMEGGRSLEEAEQQEFDDLRDEVAQIDSDLARFNHLAKMQAQSATPVSGDSPANGSASRGPMPKQTASSSGPMILTHPKEQDEAFKGQNFVRKLIARAHGKFFDEDPVAVAKARWGKANPRLVEVIAAGVPGHGSGTGEPGGELVSNDNRYTGDFIEFLYSMTVYNQLPLRVAPANVNIKGQDGAATGYWVGEGQPIPNTAADFSDVNLLPLKAAALAVATKELLRDSSPAAEQLVRDALVEAASQRIDTTFMGGAAAVAGVSPAGLLNGLTAGTSAGTDTAGVLADIQALRATFITAKNSGGLYWAMNPNLASSLSLIRNALGQKEFTEINQDGGVLEGNPVVVGHNINPAHLVLVKPSDIYRIEAGSLEVTMSEHATIEMDDAPTGETDTPTAASVNQVSMFQTDSIAMKVIMPINFQKRRASAVAYIGDASYG